MLKVGLLVSLVLLCISCGNRKVSNLYVMINNSDDSIMVYYDVSEHYEYKHVKNIDSVLIAPKTEKVFYIGLGTSINPINKNDNYLSSFDTIYIYSNRGRLKSDFYNPQKWSYKKDWSAFKGYKTYFKYCIDNNDIAR